ncbi:hypothetical protein LOZ12_003906 [Ophidiomyces ophidiicola]|uniref:Uncharacterized protein n=1 Tax=Ophidiomyces ophidiicola TaxID=1387563 RepID=A0ACB8UVR6_9EURO|nr:hypothetical protein LOZ61_004748 [Ophidiomyces ophidiicola]KAI1924059.1 hypothetical protein LOZ64_000801 [Ophidiomyces ophidiicola]KAI1925065.1 hypothetical protein LOZ60_004344 [Ophidiomyces ophidiicola]KAI1944610.1 hypothetical protein LOZ62_004105 [Ophidiomyces ophidiicola]KAI1950749.1 hypothetical protein LOZ59_005773 [Ophidiomyces ophidiicola]
MWAGNRTVAGDHLQVEGLSAFFAPMACAVKVGDPEPLHGLSKAVLGGKAIRILQHFPQHRGQGPKQPWDSQIRETNLFTCESTAYRRLTHAGVCARGITPQFYGTIENIDPTQCLPHLELFVKDEYPPTAIFLEYIPNMKELRWTDYNESRMRNFVDGLNAIHDALVYHDDVHPRNMMIVEEDPERAIWIDFDRAQTFDGEVKERQKGWIAGEKELMAEMADFMKDDFVNGTFNKTCQYYR